MWPSALASAGCGSRGSSCTDLHALAMEGGGQPPKRAGAAAASPIKGGRAQARPASRAISAVTRTHLLSTASAPHLHRIFQATPVHVHRPTPAASSPAQGLQRSASFKAMGDGDGGEEGRPLGQPLRPRASKGKGGGADGADGGGKGKGGKGGKDGGDPMKMKEEVSAMFDANALLIQRIRQNLLNSRQHAENAPLLQILRSNLRTLVGWLEPEPSLGGGALKLPPMRVGLGPALLALLEEEPPRR